MKTPARCDWGDGPADLIAYHDTEWGRPLQTDQQFYERLSLEAFQSGLSWLTILRKREGFRKAFHGFDPQRVAKFGERDIERLMQDAGIIRNRPKILAAIANATALLELQRGGESLASLVRGHAPKKQRVLKRSAQIPATTPESVALAKVLKKKGFRFVGPTTVYALMQASGIVNDHLERCFVRAEVEKLRRAVR